MLQASLQGLGVALAPLAVVRQELADGRLLRLFSRVHLVGPAFYSLQNLANESAGLQEFMTWLHETAAMDCLHEKEQQSTYRSADFLSETASVF